MENRLFATIVPKFDERDWGDFTKKLSTSISSAVGSSVQVPTGSNTESTAVNSATQALNALVEKIKSLNFDALTNRISNIGSAGTSTSRAEASNRMDDVEQAPATTKLIDKVTKKFKELFNLENLFGKDGDGIGKAVESMKSALTQEMIPYIGIVIGIVSAIFKIMDALFDKMLSASPMLRTIIGLIESVFTAVFRPMGTILAQYFVPMLLEVYQILSKWFSVAYKTYEEEGWAGLIIGTFSTLVDMISKVLGQSFKLLYTIFTDIMTGIVVYAINSMIDFFGGDFEVTYQDIYKFVKNFTDLVSELFIWLVDQGFALLKNLSSFLIVAIGLANTAIIAVEALLGVLIEFVQNLFENVDMDSLANDIINGIGFIRNIMKDMLPGGQIHTLMSGSNTIIKAVKELFDAVDWVDVANNISKLLQDFTSLFGSIDWTNVTDAVSGILSEFKSLFENVNGQDIANLINNVSDIANKVVGSPTVSTVLESADGWTEWVQRGGIASAENVQIGVDWVKQQLGLQEYATGGVVNKPTLALIGEAGPEAVIPLNGNGGAVGNVINNYWNITGVSDEKLVTIIKREVSSQTSLARTRVGF